MHDIRTQLIDVVDTEFLFKKYLIQNLHSLKYDFSQFIKALKAQYDLHYVGSAFKP